MSSVLNDSEIDREKMDKSYGAFTKSHLRNRTNIPKTPETMTLESYINTLNSQRHRVLTVNYDPNISLQALKLGKGVNSNKNSNVKKRYMKLLSEYEQINSQLSNIHKKIDLNNEKIKNNNNSLKKLKQEKKKNQADLVNLLANKESLEEIFKNKVYYSIYYKNNSEPQWLDNEKLKIDEEEEFEIKIDEIQKSEKNTFIEQIISLLREILGKIDENQFLGHLKEKINIAYKVFNCEVNSISKKNQESIVSNFFSRISVFIS